MSMTPSSEREFLVVCLCADWCGTCRDYRPVFEGLKKSFPDADFIWVDIEDQAELINDIEVEDFPTLLIQRRQWVLFFGTMLPHARHLESVLGMFREQSAEEARAYALATAERRGWQDECNLRALLEADRG